MKKSLIIVLLALACVAAIMPPKLPSGFYGDVTGKVGQVVTVKSDGVTLASTNVRLDLQTIVFRRYIMPLRIVE